MNELGIWVDPDKSGIFPEFQTQGSACFDLHAQSNKGYTLYPGDHIHIPTGLHLDIPKGYVVEVFIRSSLAYKHGLMLTNGVGVIDSDYTGEIIVMLSNMGNRQVSINPGDRVAQARMVPVTPTVLVDSKEPPKLKGDRKGGFGSTGR